MFQRIVIAPLNNPHWEALRPQQAHAAAQGRPMADLRHLMDAICHPLATVARHFRRLTGAGLRERLWQALADLGPRHPPQTLRRVIFRAARRAYCMRGLSVNKLARRPGSADFAWMLPDPDLSQTLIHRQLRRAEIWSFLVHRFGKALRNLMGIAGGRMRLSPYQRQAQP